MIAALIYKEVREVVGIAAVGLVALLVVALSSMGLSPIPGLFGPVRPGTIPFVNSSFGTWFVFAAGGLALALGFRQSLGDFWGDAQLFLLHRPISRGRIYGTKLAVGLVVSLVCGLAAVLLYAVWAATPGTHASPFEWSMTAGCFATCCAMTTVYLGAFLSGVRPAAWFGLRLAPLALAMCLAWIAAVLWLPLAVLVVVAADWWLGSAILTVVKERNFT